MDFEWAQYNTRETSVQPPEVDSVGCARSVPAPNQPQLTPAHSNQDSDLSATGFLLIWQVLRNPTHRT